MAKKLQDVDRIVLAKKLAIKDASVVSDDNAVARFAAFYSKNCFDKGGLNLELTLVWILSYLGHSFHIPMYIGVSKKLDDKKKTDLVVNTTAIQLKMNWKAVELQRDRVLHPNKYREGVKLLSIDTSESAALVLQKVLAAADFDLDRIEAVDMSKPAYLNAITILNVMLRHGFGSVR